jgi:hypothetical protein
MHISFFTFAINARVLKRHNLRVTNCTQKILPTCLAECNSECNLTVMYFILISWLRKPRRKYKKSIMYTYSYFYIPNNLCSQQIFEKIFKALQIRGN